MNPDARQAAIDAAKDHCAACGKRLGASGVLHHRQARGMGGRRGGRDDGTYTDGPPNGIMLHDWCHRLVHANPRAARAAGLIVPSWTNPALVPVTRLDLTL